MTDNKKPAMCPMISLVRSAANWPGRQSTWLSRRSLAGILIIESLKLWLHLQQDDNVWEDDATDNPADADGISQLATISRRFGLITIADTGDGWDSTYTVAYYSRPAGA